MGDRRKKGKGTVRERSDGRWEGRVIAFYDDNNKPKYKSVFGKSKSEVQEKLKRLMEEQPFVGGKTPSKSKAEMKFGEWIDVWFRSYVKPSVRETTQECYENYIYRHIIPSIGSIPLSELTQKNLQDFYGDLKTEGRAVRAEKFGEGLSDRMVRGSHALCRKCLEKAVEQGLIPINPAIGCKLPPKKAREMQVLTHSELQQFLVQAHYEGYYEFYLMEFATGLRRGEICGLQWGDLDLATGALRIQRQVVSVSGGISITELKTKTSNRTIILSPSVLNVMRKLQTGSESKWMFPSPVKEDMPYNPQSVYRKTRLILQRSGCKKIRFHDLRHTFATMALENGMDIKTLSNMIGHISADTTLNIYSHITNEMQQNAARKIDAGIGREDPNLRDEIAEALRAKVEPPKPVEYSPYKGKIRKSGTGGIYEINDHLYEGRYTPTNAYGKRESHNVYAHTREECEILLEEMIADVRSKIAKEKEMLAEKKKR